MNTHEVIQTIHNELNIMRDIVHLIVKSGQSLPNTPDSTLFVSRCHQLTRRLDYIMSVCEDVDIPTPSMCDTLEHIEVRLRAVEIRTEFLDRRLNSHTHHITVSPSPQYEG